MGYQCAGGIYLNLWLNLWLNSLENLAQPVHIEWEEVQLFSKPDPLHFNWFLVCPLCSCYLLLSYQKRNNSVLEKQVERKKKLERIVWRPPAGLVSSIHLHRQCGHIVNLQLYGTKRFAFTHAGQLLDFPNKTCIPWAQAAFATECHRSWFVQLCAASMWEVSHLPTALWW